MMRSTPVFFLQDDYDYFENDEADDKLVTFPPDRVHARSGARVAIAGPPGVLTGCTSKPKSCHQWWAADRPAGISESFGTLRYGKLLELLMYDCRRYMTLTGPQRDVRAADRRAVARQRAWPARMRRMSSTCRRHRLAGAPANGASGMPTWTVAISRLTTKIPKAAIGSRVGGFSTIACCRRHPQCVAASRCSSAAIFTRSAKRESSKTSDIDLRSNPVISVLPGPVGTGRPGWPSLVRGLRALPPAGLEVEEGLPALEENGFTIADFTPERVTLRYFSWKLGRPEAASGHARAISRDEPGGARG